MTRVPKSTSEFPPHACLPRLLESHVEQTPEAVAIAAPGRMPLSYGLLLTQVRKIVTALNAAGVGRHDCVAIVLPNGPEMAVTLVAVAAGATSAPLNPGCRASEFDFYLSDMSAKALIVQSGIESPARAVARAHGIPIIELSPVLAAPAGVFTLSDGKRPPPARGGFAQPEDVAVVLHTSGTTSRPKLVPLTHTNVCASAHNIGVALELSDRDRCLNVMPLFHVHGLCAALFASLMAGGSVVCTPGFDAGTFFEWMETFRPTWYTAVPSMHQALLARLAATREPIARCPLRLIRSASAPLSPGVMAELESVFHVPVLESYAMTEAATQVTSNPLPPRERKPGSGGVAAGPEVAIMNEAADLAPVGEKGEIVIRGANVMQGYAHNPAANQEAFTSGWFRTGDEGYLDTDGYLFVTGRLKEIINRGGEKVSPPEIDAALTDHPDVRQAVAFPVPHPSLGEDIAAAVVLRDEASITEPMIREYLFGRLADFKIPSQVLIVDEIPKGATGKVRRFELAEKFARQLKGKFVAPTGEIQSTIAAIYAEVLGIEQVGAGDNFFALGGDSLSATQVLSRINPAFQVNLPIITLFRRPTVAELAGEIAMSRNARDQMLTADILAELATLSDEDAQRLLEAELGRDPSAK